MEVPIITRHDVGEAIDPAGVGHSGSDGRVHTRRLGRGVESHRNTRQALLSRIDETVLVGIGPDEIAEAAEVAVVEEITVGDVGADERDRELIVG